MDEQSSPEFKLYDYSVSYNNLGEVIRANPDMDNEELLQALENIQENAQEKIANTGELIRKLSDDVDIINKRLKELNAAKKSLTNKIDSIKNYLLINMQQLDMKKVSTGTITVSIRNNAPKLHITNETKIPQEFLEYGTVLNVDAEKLPKKWQKYVHEESVKVKKAELTKSLKDLDESEYPDYARLEPNPSITIK